MAMRQETSRDSPGLSFNRNYFKVRIHSQGYLERLRKTRNNGSFLV